MSGSRLGHHSLSAAHARPWRHKYFARCLVSTRVIRSHHYICAKNSVGPPLSADEVKWVDCPILLKDNKDYIVLYIIWHFSTFRKQNEELYR
jgi:hypothetical protein